MTVLSSLAILVVGSAVGTVRPSRATGAPDQPPIRIDGATGGDPAGAVAGGLAGISVARVGDVNSDGRPDILIGAPEEDNNGRANSGSAYVVFGQPTPTTIDLSNLGSQGFRIDGARAGELAAGQ